MQQQTYPESWIAPLVLAGQPAVAATNFAAVAFQSARYLGMFRLSTGAQNATMTMVCSVPSAGTWTLTMYHNAAADRGIYTVNIDGVDVGTVDGYATGGTQTVSAITGLALTAGKHTIKLTMATKNASSSGYTGDWSAIGFTRTA